jgi:hypothetical protein
MTSLRELRNILKALPLTDAQLKMCRQAAAPLPSVDRALFFAAIATLFRGCHDVGDGQLNRALRQLQHAHLRAPQLPEGGATFETHWYDRR